jgi:hypothetical protein
MSRSINTRIATGADRIMTVTNYPKPDITLHG